MERRFDRRDSSADMFLPVLSEKASSPVNDARRFSHAVGVRGELTPAVFTLRDARSFACRRHTPHEVFSAASVAVIA